ncbi:MAG: histidinol dehydrogenase [Thermodesulfobacteriota bacterium]
MRTLSSQDKACKSFLESLASRGGKGDQEVEERVREILSSIQRGGKEELLSWARKLDGMPQQRDTLELDSREWGDACERLGAQERTALETAARRIRGFHERIKAHSWLTVDPEGCLLGQLVQPLKRVGIYVPGGKASYPSSVLMTAIPARVAGVSEVIMCCPLPWSDPSPAVLAAAKIAGVDRIFRLGGAQAIVAMAYGVGEVPRVDKIVGPGNAYVTAAKRVVFGDVDIDMLAGPSEILIVADGTVAAGFAAADMLSQAEHDERASSLLLTPSASYAQEVDRELERRLRKSPRRGIAQEALERFGAIIVCSDLDEALEMAADVAPEHLELLMERPLEWLSKVRNAGAVFLGPWSAEAVGDYLAGPSHVLPTGGTARFSSPLGVEDFLRRTSVISVPRGALTTLGPKVVGLAEMEGLDAHAESVRTRMAWLENNH